MKMFVVKRDGRKEEVDFQKVLTRISNLVDGLDQDFIDAAVVAQKVVAGIYPGVTSVELDALAAETAAYMASTHPDYAVLAARLSVSNLHKQTTGSLLELARRLHGYVEPRSGRAAPLLADDVLALIETHHERLEAAIDHSRDFDCYSFFGFKTLERSYLLRLDGQVAERPQLMLMRVALGIHKADIDAALETYEMLSQGLFTHASPTLFNAGTPRPQLSSCFLVAMKDDSIDGIYDTLKECAQISKSAGGIGLHVSNIRAMGSYIRGTNGTSNGLVPMLRVFNDTARYVDQGGGKRKGAIAIYLEPWHADVLEFLELKKNHGKEENRARDLFYGLWVPDLFMKRVEAAGEWSLMCPVECPGLQDACGDEFEKLYTRYEAEGRARRTIPAREVWSAIINAQMETGVPYMLYKDAANLKSNQRHLGTIKSSNLCTEIIEYSSPDETAVCNLASICLSKFASPAAEGADRAASAASFDHEGLARVTRTAVRNLNRVIDVNHYPTAAAKKSNLRHRPIGIGVQGLADAFCILRLPYECDEARELNRDIFETMYHAAVTASVELARDEGLVYETFRGSPASEGILQFDMWGVTPGSGRYDWAKVRADVIEHGMANSLLLAPMPTASTASILGNNESTEPFTSNIYSRRVLAGEFTVINQHLLRDLIRLGIWSDNLKHRIIANAGSVVGLDEVPKDIQELYKCVWEMKQRRIVDMAADRGAFICQSQSLNIHIAAPTPAIMTSLHFHTWKSGLKTGQYYLRTKPAAAAIQFTTDKAAVATGNAIIDSSSSGKGSSKASAGKLSQADEAKIVGAICTMEEGCISCGS